jgi:HEAT repeat protein
LIDMADEVANLVARAVRTYKPDDDQAWTRFETVRRQIAREPEAAVAAARRYVTSDVPTERGAAAMIIGEVVSLKLPEAAKASSELLFQQLLIETDQRARDDLAVAIGKIWNAYDPQGTPLGLASHPNRNIRYAAAKNLGLSTTDRPDDAAARAILKTLTNDPDAEVRWWAEFGLETLSID